MRRLLGQVPPLSRYPPPRSTLRPMPLHPTDRYIGGVQIWQGVAFVRAQATVVAPLTAPRSLGPRRMNEKRSNHRERE
jgi:hypothetical protein